LLPVVLPLSFEGEKEANQVPLILAWRKGGEKGGKS